ncbi:hypothetical protein [Alloalcanivorax gelatiniphagus]|uniref:Uncharacterized protein n=1 Tax=Alloalcanivorax gelatiniphagus TaxID=1194167 RepID=A0ABY2XJL7_9GAMM|nr:hypothetical protein [Alloalcanivorax gelatiniphagus]TMW12142.1 hypothetical protein FGS76_11650 [Alloalcanivorax gelatiniphagus]|tara:strand:- start:2834 stop:3028 length:195 start_codon:yes stop_codon:yes gene_type:complete
MNKLAIQGLIAITSALWLPAQADLTRAAWDGDSAGETRTLTDDAAENSPVLLLPVAGRDQREKG